MAKRALDTNILINHWLRVSKGCRPREIDARQAGRWGRELMELQRAGAILTPIYIEYVCGQGSAHEVNLARTYLKPFEIADEGHILPKDWENARKIAERVPRDGLRRQLGDCLIRAICVRLNLEFITAERRFPHRVP
ncbi:MAG: hypothetical protein JWP03_1210 [Phycisphaerales bacterium]|jgi:predicted nucleic acid-binding protein|nr:hypothetical protein [Phycisphaerales bacterium]